MKGKPFLFDSNIFDDDAPAREEEDVPVPEFTADELEQAKQQAFEAGKKAGFDESQNGLTKQILTLVQKIDQAAGHFFIQEEERRKIYENEAVRLTLSVLRRLFPVTVEKCGNEEISRVLADEIQAQNEGKDIAIEVPPGTDETLSSYMDQIAAVNGEHLKIRSAPGLSTGECRMLWEDGGMICDIPALAEKIAQILEETLAAQGINSHDTEDFQPGGKNRTGASSTATNPPPDDTSGQAATPEKSQDLKQS